MKLTLEITKKGLRIRKEILNASGFHREAALDVRGMEQAIAVMKKEMTAMELGLMDGTRKLPLIRRSALLPNEEAHENVLVTDQLTSPPWRGALEVLTAARKCVSALKVRYCLDRDLLVPKPAELPEELRQSGFGPPAVRRVYIAAAGWLTPAELKRRFPEERGVFSYPLVLKYLTDVHLDDGPRTMELSHWDLRRLEARAGTFAASK